MKDEKGCVAPLNSAMVKREVAEAKPTTPARPKHQAESESPENDRRYTKIGEVFDRNVDIVLTTRKTRLETQESSLH